MSDKPQIATLAEIKSASTDTQSGTLVIPSITDHPNTSRSKCITATTVKMSVETIRYVLVFMAELLSA
jgi:hypothetical protein